MCVCVCVSTTRGLQWALGRQRRFAESYKLLHGYWVLYAVLAVLFADAKAFSAAIMPYRLADDERT